jgi:hypothetical protein
MPTRDELRHLHLEVKTALELAIAARAPWPITDGLAAAAGLLDALSEVPDHVLIPAVIERSRTALSTWERWQEQQSHQPSA